MRAIQPDAGYYNDVSIRCHASLIETSLLGHLNYGISNSNMDFSFYIFIIKTKHS